MSESNGPATGRGAGRVEHPRGRPTSLRHLALDLRRHWLASLAALVVLLILAVRFLRRPEGESPDAPPVVTAETGMTRVGDFAVTIDALGTVQPRPGAFAQIAAPAATRVARILVATGDRVRAGQALVRLDESVWVLQARQARIALDAAQSAYDRAQRLFAEGISPRKDVEGAATDLARARAELESARHTEALGTLRSPIDGVVTQLRASLSQPVDANQPLVDVVNPAGLDVLFHLSPEDAARLARGDEVALTAAENAPATGAGTSGAAETLGASDMAAGAATKGSPSALAAYGAPSPGRQFLGRGAITGISAALDSAGSVDVRATVRHPAVPLRAGQTVSGHLVVAHHAGAVIVPVGALVPAGGSIQVFVVDANGVAHATPVTVGARNDREAEVLAGLRGGETVVTRGAYGVTDSATIRAPGQPASASSPEGAGA